MMIITILIITVITLLLLFYSRRVVSCSKLPSAFSRIAKILLTCINLSILALIILGTVENFYGGGTINLIKIAILMVIVFVVPQIFLLITNIPIEIAQLITKRKQIKTRRIFLGLFSLLVLYIGCVQIIPDTNYKIYKEVIEIKSLPKSFDGFKIVQISDIHIASLSDREYDALNNKMTELCNSLDPDILVLTGDIIHSFPSELEGREEFLSKLKAKTGKYFIYGNHDIGSYNSHLTPQQKAEDIESLRQIVEKGGFKIIKDTVETITRNDDTIYILGVDESTWGDYFDRYKKTVSGLNKDMAIISLAHNPTFYDRIINNKPEIVPQLTLAGHTHAMQMEFSLFGYSWSPSDLMNKYSRGLYKVDENYIYVNRGLGYHVYRRIGSRPEITLIELRGGGN